MLDGLKATRKHMQDTIMGEDGWLTFCDLGENVYGAITSAILT